MTLPQLALNVAAAGPAAIVVVGAITTQRVHGRGHHG